MRYFYDTEFIEDGTTIELVSIGMVAEDGREYYAVSTDFAPRRANPWVKKHVLPQLPPRSDPVWKTRSTIRSEITAFLTADSQRPELWAWVGAYDHVVLAQLWGSMRSLPRFMPHFTHELKQHWEAAGCPVLPDQAEGLHNALEDARYNRDRFTVITRALPRDGGFGV